MGNRRTTKRNTVTLIACILSPLCFTAFSQQQKPKVPLAQDYTEKKIFAVLDRMVKQHETYLSVPVQDGKALRLLTEVAGAKNVVEIGTSTGYSGLWLCLALRATSEPDICRDGQDVHG